MNIYHWILIALVTALSVSSVVSVYRDASGDISDKRLSYVVTAIVWFLFSALIYYSSTR